MTKATSSLVLLILVSATISGQGLFESSLSESSGTPGQEFLTIGGFIRSAVYIGNTPEKEEAYLQSAYAQASLQLKARAGSKVSAFTDIRFRYGTEWQENIAEIDLREAYVDLQSGPVGFRLGKQIVPWGKGTLFNPVNKLTPIDPTTRSPEMDDMNLGIWALQGNVNMGSYLKLSATWNPIYQPGILLIDPIPMPEYVFFLEPDYPGVNLDEGNYGIQLDLRAPVMDAAFYWFDGYHNWPGIAFDSFVLDTLSMEPLALNLYEKAYRIMMAGLDFSIPLGSWIFTAEGAWFQTKENHEGKEYLPFPELSYTAEIEKSGSWLTVIAGYHGKHIMDYIPAQAKPELSAEQEQFLPLMEEGIGLTSELVDGAVKEQIAAFNRLYNYQLEEFYHSSFLVLRGDFIHSMLEVELPVIYNFTTEEWTIQPAISWMPADGIRVKAGFIGLWGGPNSLYDLVGPVLNAGFIAMTLTF
jgi:hypothetical protein